MLQIIDVGNDMGGYLILRRQGDRVYGYPSGWRTFWSLKTDGPFLCSEWAGTKESVVSLRFTDGGYEQVEHLTAEGEQFIFTSFTVEGRQVTEEEWQAAWTPKSRSRTPGGTHCLRKRNNRIRGGAGPKACPSAYKIDER